VQDDWSAVSVKGSCPLPHFHRLRAIRGAKETLTGVAASMPTAAWHLLRTGTPCAAVRETATGMIHRLPQIGYAVRVTAVGWKTRHPRFASLAR
jgi:hypothetical protein